jgi:Protein of unknown function (DUF3341)
MPDALVAVYSDPDAAACALRALKAAGVPGVRVVSPAPYPAVHLTGQPGPWRHLGTIALIGGLTGLGSATALQVMTSRSLNMIVGGKPIVSWPAFGVVMFELTMLFAGIFNFSALVLLGALARRRVSARARGQVDTERIVVVVPVDQAGGARQALVRTTLKDALEVLP